MGSKVKDDFEPYWDEEKDWLCTVEFLPRDDPEARSFSAEIIGYLFGYAHLTNTRSLALLGDPDANAYELLFSFSSPEEKEHFLDLVRYNDNMGNDYIENAFMSPTTEESPSSRDGSARGCRDPRHRNCSNPLCQYRQRGACAGYLANVRAISTPSNSNHA